ncbi:MAG: Asp-tRNA(Asn)/Glu-tRNA(Gln) amidotransferase subunit GatB [Candidatus Omnitrophota bacterium]
MNYEIIIGLEVHVQLSTATKAFCGCSTSFESSPNENICPVCCGYPGVLPVFNQRALQLALRVCLALNCRVNQRIYFERKNYFYPDLPKNYQISQYKLPLGEDGFMTVPPGKKVWIQRVHIEEDAGKLIHKQGYSLIDLNRTGIPLLEIVTLPDINSPQEAFSYLNFLKLTLQYIDVSSCDMEKGYLRCDANISLKEKGEKALGTKVELKNMNSFRGVRDALEYESRRQAACLERKQPIIQETRLWDEAEKKSVVMRVKEEAHDYRYFPEPDLADFVVDKAMIENEKKSIEELPLDKYERFRKEYGLRDGGLSDGEINTLISNKWLANFFEASVKEAKGDFKNVANWILGPFLEITNSFGGDYSMVYITPTRFAKIVSYFVEGKINNLAAKRVLAICLKDGGGVDAVIEREGLSQVSSHDGLYSYIDEAVSQNPEAVSDFLQGKRQAVMFLVGQVMKKSKGKANPKVAKELLEARLKNQAK